MYLELNGQIRDAISVTPKEFNLGRVQPGQAIERFFDIGNYGERDINVPTLRPSEKWVAAQIVPIQLAQSSQSARQLWRVTVRVDTRRLPFGSHRSQIKLELDPADSIGREVPIDFYVTPGVDAIPEQVFFASVRPDAPAKRTVLLRFSSDITVNSAGEIQLEHNLGDCLTLACRPARGNDWELSATMTPKGKKPGDILDGEIIVRFPGRSVPELRIPVYGKVRAQ